MIEARVADRFRVVELVSTGPASRVYHAVDEACGTRCALKVLTAEFGADAVVRARFRREIELANRIAHPAAVPVLDHGELANGLPYFVMPFLEGVSLHDAIVKEGAFSNSRVGALGGELLDYLEALHGLGVAHRDIKPANVLLERDAGGAERLRVLDLGVATYLHAAHRAQEEAGWTPIGFAMGTPSFASPARRSGAIETDDAADRYAAAMVIYMMWTGQTPFDAEHPATGKPIPFAAFLRASPPGADSFFERALAPAPGDRYSTARDLRAAFVRAIDGATP
ncbi:MAG: serine/threonine-protein kinase [Polyangiales bacterium]